MTQITKKAAVFTSSFFVWKVISLISEAICFLLETHILSKSYAVCFCGS